MIRVKDSRWERRATKVRQWDHAHRQDLGIQLFAMSLRTKTSLRPRITVLTVLRPCEQQEAQSANSRPDADFAYESDNDSSDDAPSR